MSKQSELDRWCVAFLDGDMSAGQFKRAVANLVTRQSNKQIETMTKRLNDLWTTIMIDEADSEKAFAYREAIEAQLKERDDE